MEHSQELIVDKDVAGVLWLTLNRPERRNALSPALYEALNDALIRAEQDTEIGAVVLTGAGAGFCAGGDVSRMNQQTSEQAVSIGTPSARVAALRERTRIVERLHNIPKPSIAMIRGAAVGAGLSLALACDLRYGDPSAKFRTGFINVGLPGDFGGHYFLPRIVGPARARELYLRSAMLSADQAAECGLLNHVFSPDTLATEVTTIAQMIAQGPQPAMRCMKANLNAGLTLSLSALLDRECERHIECVDSPDHKEAVRAFMEKRRPVFNHSPAAGAQPSARES